MLVIEKRDEIAEVFDSVEEWAKTYQIPTGVAMWVAKALSRKGSFRVAYTRMYIAIPVFARPR